MVTYIKLVISFTLDAQSKEQTNTGGGEHPRHTTDHPSGIRQIRTAKYRYVYFCTSDKKLKRTWQKALRYEVLPYPKGDNCHYELGTFYKPVLIDKDKNIINGEDKDVMKITVKN